MRCLTEQCDWTAHALTQGGTQPPSTPTSTRRFSSTAQWSPVMPSTAGTTAEHPQRAASRIRSASYWSTAWPPTMRRSTSVWPRSRATKRRLSGTSWRCTAGRRISRWVRHPGSFWWRSSSQLCSVVKLVCDYQSKSSEHWKRIFFFLSFCEICGNFLYVLTLAKWTEDFS